MKGTEPKKVTLQQQYEATEKPYGFAGYNFYEDQNSNFAIKPPFGTLNAIDMNNGEIFWEYILPGMATSIPSTYSIGGKQYVAVAVSPNPATNFKGGYMTFSLE